MNFTYTKTINYDNGFSVTYKVSEGGIAFHNETPDELCKVIETCVKQRRRVRIFYGDETGRDWGEEYNIIGNLYLSVGNLKVPCLSGSAILDHCVVKMMDTKTKQVLYQHPEYHHPVYTLEEAEGYTIAVMGDGKNVANFNAKEKAINWIKFMTGQRMKK